MPPTILRTQVCSMHHREDHVTPQPHRWRERNLRLLRSTLNQHNGDQGRHAQRGIDHRQHKVRTTLSRGSQRKRSTHHQALAPSWAK